MLWDMGKGRERIRERNRRGKEKIRREGRRGIGAALLQK